MNSATLKQQLRQAAQRRRAALTDRPERSRQILDRLLSLPEFLAARSVLFYISVRNEVETGPALPTAISRKPTLAVPYCEHGQLQLIRLQSVEELAPGSYGIPEPPTGLRTQPNRILQPSAIDLVVVPGVAFDRQGNRLGHGAGYYDKLLAQVRPDTTLVALAFDCQLVDAIPTEPHDVPMHRLLTETQSLATRNQTQFP